MPLRDGMPHWPGDPAFASERIRTIAGGDDYNLTAIHLSAHTGTHVDAPLHFLDGAAAVEAIDLDALAGPATVIEGRQLQGEADERVLFRCGSEISPVTARALVERGVRAAGIDSLSIGDAETHRILLGAGVVVIEGLDLSQAPPGRYELVCLPLLLVGADGAPARALLRALI